ncbi:MAG: pentapeptide repeat-containing protein [Alphaproteobacteria bacterium]
MMTKERVTEFEAKNAQSYPCGKKGLIDLFRETTYINDLDGKILYEGRGTFQRVLEQAVREGVELPKADLSNKVFQGLTIPGAKIPGASFENSKIVPQKTSKYPIYPDLAKCDLTSVIFKNSVITPHITNLDGSDVANADFTGTNLYAEVFECSRHGRRERLIPSFWGLKNLDKAQGVDEKTLKSWIKFNPEPNAVNVAQMMKAKTR